MTKTLRPIYCLALSVFLLVLMSQQADAGKHRILKVDDFRKGEVFCRGFEIKEPLTVDIYAIGSGWKSGRSLTAYGWIIRSGSLEPVWVMDSRNTDRIGRDKKLREYDSSIELEPGRYEAYFYAGTPYGSVSYSIEINNLGDIYELVIDALNKSSISKLEDLEDELEDLEDELEDLEDELEDLDEEYEHESGEMKRLLKKQSRIVEDYLLEITTDSKDFSREGCSYSSDCVIAEILEPDHDLYSSVGFSLDKPVDVKIAALGEYSDFDDVFMDHGWLLDADSRQQVWSMERRNTEPAGGADKNRMATAELQLEKGNYLLYYVTDDSHAFDDWNAAPPYNPAAYGIRVTAVDKDDLEYIKPYRDSYSESALMTITRVGDNECELRSFKVNDECDIRVLAIGEYDRSDEEFCDYAWIERVGEDGLVWEMEKSNTRHAGGGAKNRMFDDVLHLQQGVYTLGYVSDGSHSYASWNTAPPYDQKNYGVSLYAVGADFDHSRFQEMTDVAEAGNVLVQLTCIGDDADERGKFTIDQPTRVRIYALGEGDKSEMYDYGWIENAKTGQVVWEMTYRKTRPAGGARKNRKLDTVITLDAGDYEVWYVSDGSHSFADWNTPRPREPHRWGITVTKEGSN